MSAASPDVPNRRIGFAVGIGATTAMLAGASAPSPFYPVLQEQLGFSAAVMTSIFAIYAGFLLLMVLVAGSLSDHVGRRPVVSAGFALLAVSMVVFWHADTVATLLAARTVQGVATGLIVSALAALVVDFERPGSGTAATYNSVAPLMGLASGALVAGVVIDVVDDALAWVFATFSLLFAAIALGVWLLPEPIRRTPGALRSLVPTVGVPQPARRIFWRSAPAIVAGWATGGLYLSLGAPLVARELGASSHAVQGLVVAALTGSGALAIVAMRARPARTVMLFGTATLAIGTVLTLVALRVDSLAAFLVIVALTGTGFGTAFYGVMRSVTPTVAPQQRGELFGAVFVIAYLAFGLPAVAAGLASPHLGLATTTYVYGAVVVVLSATAFVLRRRSDG